MENSTADQTTSRRLNKPYTILMMQRIMRRPSILIAGLGVYAGAGMMILGERKIPFTEFLSEYGWQALGGMLMIISFIFIFHSMPKSRDVERFIDVDDKRKSLRSDERINALINEIESLKKTQPEIDYKKIESLIKQSTESVKKNDDELLKTFENYFNGIRRTLEEKIMIADEKASILLDKGTAYSKGGITFFIISIFLWQLLSWMQGFQTQFIYGIASCSILFIFIEFLSAWFLKQYRQFIDTSTYLIKVKSIFDKYMLSYLILKEGDNKERLYEMIVILKEDIKWPDSYILKNGDINFAKETIESLTSLVKHMTKTINNDPSKNNIK